MARFASKEEYEAWKASQAAVGAPQMTTAPATSADALVTRPATPVAAAQPPPKKKEGLKEAFSGIPAWAWPFVVACFAIPVVTLGGALPTGIGFGAASGVAQVAKKPDWETPPKVAACAAIAGAAWLLVFGLIAAIAARR